MSIKRTAIAALASATLFTGLAAHATSTGRAKWTHYFDRRTGNVIVVKTVCLDAEDSAAHLKLRAFLDSGGHVTLGCYKRGY